MTKTMLKDRFPKGHKSTWYQQAIDICAGKIQLSSGELADLLYWLEDCNWPGAHEIASFLEDKADVIVPKVESILRHSDDMRWKYWLITSLVLQWPERHVVKLRSALLTIARGSDSDEAHIVALEALIRNNLIASAEATLLLERKADEFPDLRDDLLDISGIMDQE